MNDNKFLINLNTINPHDLYNIICTNMSFNDVVELYKYLKHKIEYLEDKPVYFCEVEIGKN